MSELLRSFARAAKRRYGRRSIRTMRMRLSTGLEVLFIKYMSPDGSDSYTAYRPGLRETE
jgi:hypothetical protein